MAESNPPKPTRPPTARTDAPPPGPGAARAAPHEGTSRVIKKGKSTRIRPQTARGEAPAGDGGVEIISSGEKLEATKVRARVQRSVPQGRGLGLREKIMISMAGVTILSAVLIFVVIYVKAVGLLSDEIDAKGLAQARLMASVDPEIWMQAMYQSERAGERRRRFEQLVGRVDESAVEALLKPDAPLHEEFQAVLRSGLGEERTKAAVGLVEKAVEQRSKNLGDREREARKERLEEAKRNPEWMRELRLLFDPFGELRPLRAGGINLLESGEVVQLSVSDVTRDPNSPAASQAAKEGEMKIGGKSNVRTVGSVEIFDATVGGTGVPVRSFKLTREWDSHLGRIRLTYFVLLSLSHIEDAKGTLRNIIFLTILLAVVASLAVAWWVSERISEPVRLLMDDINAVSAGDLTHETVPRSSDEIGELALTFNRMTQALKAAHDQELEARALEHELGIAAEIQANLVPKKMLKLPGYDISAYYRPSKEVGGDYYDFIEIDPDHHGIVVADVSGKGVPGSLVMAMARAFLRMEAERSRNTSPADTLKRANAMLAADIRKGMFVTAVYCVLNDKTRRVSVTSAGHNPMLIWRGASNEIELVNPKGIALGFDKGPVFDRTISEESVLLEPGDRIVLYTDGAVEAMNEAQEEFGDDRFRALVKELATRDSNQFLNLLVKALDEHAGSAPQHDDMTIVTVRYTG